ncbi:lipoprotein [Actimicrobium antarcticum]|uniref:Lipoprotein n=1 Tax=Actimicrobium antarcticum TaxID=1051899 RepID=A0ABP7TWQ1_9BURK
MKHTLPLSSLPVLLNILLAGVFLGGCGQRGPLTLPVRPPAPISATAAPASAPVPVPATAPTVKSTVPTADTAPK